MIKNCLLVLKYAQSMGHLDHFSTYSTQINLLKPRNTDTFTTIMNLSNTKHNVLEYFT